MCVPDPDTNPSDEPGDEQEDRFSDEELRTLLTRVISTIHEGSAPDGVAQRIEAALAGRRRRSET